MNNFLPSLRYWIFPFFTMLSVLFVYFSFFVVRPIHTDQVSFAIESKLVQETLKSYISSTSDSAVTIETLVNAGYFERDSVRLVEIIDYGSGPIVVPKTNILIRSKR